MHRGKVPGVVCELIKVKSNKIKILTRLLCRRSSQDLKFEDNVAREDVWLLISVIIKENKSQDK